MEKQVKLIKTKKMACLLSLNLTIMSLNVIGLIKQLKKSDRTDLKKSLPTVCFYEKSSL